MILVDTNVLVHAINTDAPQHEMSRALVKAVQTRRLDGALLPQILLEFFAIITDGRRVARPLGAKEAWEQVKLLKVIFPVLDAGLKSLEYLKDAVTEGKVKGSDIFNAYLVAQMRACGISVICTYNTRDFQKYSGIIVQTPEELIPSRQDSGH
ncbi:MAG: PIN domain-containing protein [Firmicutes bacterium]|nr:PIN domain-containing protein [Bacillota bacterium]